jgi:hypothetical protein
MVHDAPILKYDSLKRLEIMKKDLTSSERKEDQKKHIKLHE